jgi:hypothetical protein
VVPIGLPNDVYVSGIYDLFKIIKDSGGLPIFDDKPHR